ncbi:uncharacterized protein BDR25DRAFT_311816 [Lindgomyces ingoldianus]|uniref:Uncharacterized protein n=1 Tax=Lindgomyces ingoldianus TaxID=673940 RepID=A0ACB6R487_9PLEO|nr:uncharacterized protein BDR25DRAFT_311816 [Lindgomyces ingoldianus]KAF2473590.1 hypothetical protein BDR25DRAFT_311816 [Lindgomyces ingoldianus]
MTSLIGTTLSLPPNPVSLRLISSNPALNNKPIVANPSKRLGIYTNTTRPCAKKNISKSSSTTGGLYQIQCASDPDTFVAARGVSGGSACWLELYPRDDNGAIGVMTDRYSFTVAEETGTEIVASARKSLLGYKMAGYEERRWVAVPVDGKQGDWDIYWWNGNWKHWDQWGTSHNETMVEVQIEIVRD